MPEFVVDRHDGSQYKVTAGSPEEASKMVQEHLQTEANTKSQTEFKDAPIWAKPFMAADDLARTTADDITFGYLDKMLGPDAQMDTAARRSRMRGADIAGGVAAGLAVPSAAPAAIARVGGGPIVRGITGLLTRGGEGAAQGVASALGHGTDAVEGGIQGGIGGVAGQVVGSGIKGAVTPVAKAISGVSDALPVASIKNVPGKLPNPARRVEAATARGEQAGGRPSDYIASFKGMNQKLLPKDILSDIRTITHGDLGTNAAKTASKLAYGASLPGLVGGGTAGIPALVAAAMAAPAVGAGANFAAGQGTKEAVEQLRRKLLNMPKFEGPISKATVDKIARATRGGVRSILDEY